MYVALLAYVEMGKSLVDVIFCCFSLFFLGKIERLISLSFIELETGKKKRYDYDGHLTALSASNIDKPKMQWKLLMFIY